MSDNSILPLGQHSLDPTVECDPIRTLLASLWCDLFWANERLASISAAQENDPGEVWRELAYLRGDTDDALQNLSRLIELLSLGHAIDLEKRMGRGNNPPYFREGESMAADAILPLGQHPLDPSP